MGKMLASLSLFLSMMPLRWSLEICLKYDNNVAMSKITSEQLN